MSLKEVFISLPGLVLYLKLTFCFIDLVLFSHFSISLFDDFILTGGFNTLYYIVIKVLVHSEVEMIVFYKLFFEQVVGF